MRKFLFYQLICLLTLLLLGCEEEFVGQPGTDKIKPNVVSDITVENIAGGAIIKYKLPNNADLLYVKGVYLHQGVEKNVTASLHQDFIKIEGFDTTNSVTVNLYSVDRSGNYSNPVEVSITPLKSPIRLIEESIEMSVDFGGIRLSWENASQTEVTIFILTENLETSEFENADVIHTKTKAGVYNLRGFDDQTRQFSVFVRDRWDNISDTINEVFTPLLEEKVNYQKISRLLLPGDNTTQYNASWAFYKMFDDFTLDGSGWHTGNPPSSPILFTIDLKCEIQLNRYLLWQRTQYEFTHYNPKKWTVYALKNSDELNALRTAHHSGDLDYWTEGFKEDWINLRDCEISIPSGSVTPNADDIDAARSGHEFSIPLTEEPVRYLRFWIEENYAQVKSANMLHIAELQFFGKIIQEFE